MSLPSLTFLFFAAAEMLAIFLCCLAFLGRPWHYRPLSLVVAISVAVLWFLRLLELPTGVHTVVLTVLYGILLVIFFRIAIPRALTASAMTVLLLLVFEYLGSIGVALLMNVTAEDIAKSQFLWVITGLPHIVLLFVTSVLLRRLMNNRRYHPM